MPFKSKAQAAYLAIHNPKVAREFAKKTSSLKGLPQHVSKRSPGKKKR